MSPRSIRLESSTSSAAVRSGCRPISRRKSCSASVVVSSASVPGSGAAGSFCAVDDLDPALLELLVQRLDVAGVEIEQLERLAQLDGLDDAGRVGALQQRLKLLVLADDRALVRHCGNVGSWVTTVIGGAGCRQACPESTLPVAAAKSNLGAAPAHDNGRYVKSKGAQAAADRPRNEAPPPPRRRRGATVQPTTSRRVQGAVEERHVRPAGLEGRPPAEPGSRPGVAVKSATASACVRARSRRSHERRAQALRREHERRVEVDEQRGLREVGAPRARAAARRGAGRRAKRSGAARSVRAPPPAPRRPPPRRTGSRSARARRGGRRPGAAAGTRARRPRSRAAGAPSQGKQRCRITRTSRPAPGAAPRGAPRSAPALITSIGRRFRSCGFAPKSHRSAVSGSYRRRSDDIASSSRSSRSAFVRVDALAARPAAHLRRADAEGVREAPLRAEVRREGLHLERGRDRHGGASYRNEKRCAAPSGTACGSGWEDIPCPNHDAARASRPQRTFPRRGAGSRASGAACAASSCSPSSRSPPPSRRWG